MSSRGLLVALGVLALFLAVFVPLARRIGGGTDARIDAERLRQTYVALTLYESTHDGLPAPNLGLVRQDLEPSDLQSVADPNVAGTDFPLDPALPSFPLRSPTRVSWSYRWHWPSAGDPNVRLDARRGLLASWWTGGVQRVNVDGSLVEKPHAALTFGDLFGK